jgi:hypothetical protein
MVGNFHDHFRIFVVMIRIDHDVPEQTEAARLCEQAEEFDRLAEEARNGFIREKLMELARLYRQQADMVELTERPLADRAEK